MSKNYSLQIGEEVSFLNENGTGVVQAIDDKGIATILTEDGFDVPYPVDQLVPRFDQRQKEESEQAKSHAPRPKGPIQEMGGFRLGMEVQVMDRDSKGIIKRFIKPNRAELEFDDLFLERYLISELMLIDEIQLRKLNESLEDVSLQDIGEAPKRKGGQRSLDDRKDQGVWEIDLHIQELIDNSYGMLKHEIVQLQLDHFDTKLNEAIERGLSKVIFIHGRGEGRLRTAIREVLKRYPNCEYLDADYKRYGVGATEVRIKFRG